MGCHEKLTCLSFQTIDEAQMFYASLNHNYEGKYRKPRKQNTYMSDKNEDELLHGMNASVSQTTLVDSFPPESQATEENIHDDPVRLFGLIRGKTEPVNQLDCDLALVEEDCERKRDPSMTQHGVVGC